MTADDCSSGRAPSPGHEQTRTASSGRPPVHTHPPLPRLPETARREPDRDTETHTVGESWRDQFDFSVVLVERLRRTTAEAGRGRGGQGRSRRLASPWPGAGWFGGGGLPVDRLAHSCRRALRSTRSASVGTGPTSASTRPSALTSTPNSRARARECRRVGRAVPCSQRRSAASVTPTRRATALTVKAAGTICARSSRISRMWFGAIFRSGYRVSTDLISKVSTDFGTSGVQKYRTGGRRRDGTPESPVK